MAALLDPAGHEHEAVELDEVDAVEAAPAGLSERADGCGFPGNRHSGPERSALRLGNVPPAIEIEALAKRYGRHVALDGVTLRVPAGTVYGFLGPNGAGKTTTMRILLGLLRADAGTARVLGRDPWSDGLAVRGQIGYLPSRGGPVPRAARPPAPRLLQRAGRLGARPP